VSVSGVGGKSVDSVGRMFDVAAGAAVMGTGGSGVVAGDISSMYVLTADSPEPAGPSSFDNNLETVHTTIPIIPRLARRPLNAARRTIILAVTFARFPFDKRFDQFVSA